MMRREGKGGGFEPDFRYLTLGKYLACTGVWSQICLTFQSDDDGLR